MQRVSEEIDFDADSGVYYVRQQSWAVAQHYTLHRVIGSGSFSCVCLATSKITNEKVALKRIPDVLQSTENAKKVLRELCILRRLSHPYCISLKHAFALPSDTGAWKFRNGELIPCSIDLYLALEYAGGGDLHNLRGQLSEHDVRRLMWQILTAVEYLHSQNVWHRDLKSANVLLTVEKGQRVCKIADFGSARSASSSLHQSEVDGDPANRSLSMGGADCVLARFNPTQQSLTQRVCTPCYRAPEVVMSRGGYTSALDMWSVGCIFAELLQRISYVGSASTPQLKVSPVFCVTGFPKTPSSGDHYDAGPGNPMTRTELDALFQVIGTPAWACIEAVDSQAWRKYLRNLPLKAGTLHRRFGYASEVAVDLLTRLLTFDPSRRCSAREAMSHEYFRPFWMSVKELASSDEADLTSTSSLFDTMDDMDEEAESSGAVGAHYQEIENPAKALKVLEEEMVQICSSKSGCDELQSMLVKECELLAVSQSRKLGREVSGRYGSVTNALAKKCMREGPSDFTKLLNEGLVIDPNCDKDMKPESFGPGRLPHVADFSKAYLDVEKHLAVGRQQEWTVVSGCGASAVNYWGVSLAPPGSDEATMDPQVKNIIRSQQLR